MVTYMIIWNKYELEERMQMGQYWWELSPTSEHHSDFQFLCQIPPTWLETVYEV